MRHATSIVVVCLALAAGAVSAQNVTILDQNNQPHDVPQQEFQVVGPHPGVIDVDHLHAQNGFFVRDINNQAINDPSPDPNGMGYTLFVPPQAPAFEPESVVLGFGVMVLGGADPDNVNSHEFVVNSHVGAFDLSVFGFSPEALLPADDQSIHESSGGK